MVLYFKIALQDRVRWKACRKHPPRSLSSATFSQGISILPVRKCQRVPWNPITQWPLEINWQGIIHIYSSSTSFLPSALIVIYSNFMIELAAAYLLPKMVTDKGASP